MYILQRVTTVYSEMQTPADAMRQASSFGSRKKSSRTGSVVNPVVKSAERETRNVAWEGRKVRTMLLTRCRARFNHLRFNNHRRPRTAEAKHPVPSLGTQMDVLAAIVGISFRPGEQTAPAETNFSFAPAGLTQRAGQ